PQRMPDRTEEHGSGRAVRRHDDVCAAGCRYEAGRRETADLVARVVAHDRYTTAWQSAGRTADPWWGPPIEGLIRDLGEGGASAVVVCSVGFVADHLEILYDLDIEARTLARSKGWRSRGRRCRTPILPSPRCSRTSSTGTWPSEK